MTNAQAQDFHSFMSAFVCVLPFSLGTLHVVALRVATSGWRFLIGQTVQGH